MKVIIMSDRGIATWSAQRVMSFGKMSPVTIDFGFLKCLICPGTCQGANIGSVSYLYFCRFQGRKFAADRIEVVRELLSIL